MLYGTVYMKHFNTRISEDCLSLGAQNPLKGLIWTKNGGHAGSNPDHYSLLISGFWQQNIAFHISFVPNCPI